MRQIKETLVNVVVVEYSANVTKHD